MNEQTKKCAVCGQSFATTRHQRKYCSDKCARFAATVRMRNLREEVKASGRICPICGKPVTRAANAKYCSDECLRKAKRVSITFDPRPVPTAEITKAKEKPAGVSDVRWRIELRRRANARHYAAYGDPPGMLH